MRTARPVLGVGSATLGGELVVSFTGGRTRTVPRSGPRSCQRTIRVPREPGPAPVPREPGAGRRGVSPGLMVEGVGASGQAVVACRLSTYIVAGTVVADPDR